MFCAVASLCFGLVYDLLGSYPRRPDDPADVDAEYEPEETLEVLEQAVRSLGHRPLRLGSPHAEVLAGGLARLGLG
jgi:D-alanine-D-alanine ligase